ncbi:hypothetical protein [uncultured Ramlibacter sp.]|uniref:hypothetical protein n=1 Tax=uncultured Ramlibacter sp. TaxID=260755 RepID=UPI002612CE8E|nr:hypothetical protein [uncultured Ramlibacter sp.]
MARFTSLLAPLLALALAGPAAAQPASGGALPPVTISAQANRDPVEKSYRKMLRGMELFERRSPQLAPGATLRFKLLPRRRSTDMSRIELDVIGSQTEFSVPVAPDHSFTLARNAKALAENAQVTPNRASGSMTWRTEIRTPGLPPGTRRLGDLRLECEVGMEAGLVSNSRTIVGQLANLLTDTPAYCRREDQLYLFFAERPIFAVTLVAGARREVLAIDRLYAAASDDAWLAADLPYCDCEVLLDRTYFLPLADARWPDDTLVQFEFMEDAP